MPICFSEGKVCNNVPFARKTPCFRGQKRNITFLKYIIVFTLPLIPIKKSDSLSNAK